MNDETAQRFSLSCVVLTRGDRPRELERAVESIRAQQGEPIQIVLVVNGAAELQVPAGVDVVRLPENVGVPAGRNIGTERTTGDAVIFLDDDGWWPQRGNAEHLRCAFLADDRLAVVAFHVLDPSTGRTERRHVPRVRVGDPERSSDVTTFLGGGCAVRRSAFEQCGHFPDEFFYCHEESDLAWAMLDCGYRIHYDAGVVMYHPSGAARSRHPDHHFFDARNRVWLARRRLPVPLGIMYILTWTAITILRERRLALLRRWAEGLRAGLSHDAGPRHVLGWRTVQRMTELGRPPII
jgi:GT2 family glycosyltransferase